MSALQLMDLVLWLGGLWLLASAVALGVLSLLYVQQTGFVRPDKPKSRRHRVPTWPQVRLTGVKRGEIHLSDRVEHAKWSSGSHSRRLGGNNSSCSRSHATKF